MIYNFYDDAIQNVIDKQFSFSNRDFWDEIKLATIENPQLSDKLMEPFLSKLHEKQKTLNLGQLKEDIIRVAKAIKDINDRPDYYENQVKHLMTIPQPEQRTEPWYKMREGMITASDWGTAIGENHNSTINKLLLKKLGYEGEQFTGNVATRWGTKYEQVATNIYEYRKNTNVIEFGLLKHPEIDFLGASPDGITPDGVMLEIKCPYRREITGIPPRYYWVQVQGQLEVCRLSRCDFLECKLMEFETSEEYFNDLDSKKPGHSKTNGNELGIVLQFEDDDGQLYFEYSPFGINLEDSNKWMLEKILERQKLNQRFSRPSYWRLEFLSCVPIYRDQVWFAKALIKLESFKKEWEFYKKVGYESLLTKKKLREKPKSKSNKIEMDLTKYEGFVKNNFGEGEDKIINKEQEKLYEGFLYGVPLKKQFAFTDYLTPELYKGQFTDDSESSTNSDKSLNDCVKKMSFGFSMDDFDEEPKVNEKKNSKSSFGFSSDFDEEPKVNKKKSSKSSFGFSDDFF